jgi:hypothetical protein
VDLAPVDLAPVDVVPEGIAPVHLAPEGIAPADPSPSSQDSPDQDSPDQDSPGQDSPTEPDELRPPGAPSAARRVIYPVLALLVGAVVAALGTATQRTIWSGLPLGLVIALALTASAAVMCRAWSGHLALAAAAVGWVVMVQLMALPGSGGDVLITDPAAAIRFPWSGLAWSYAGAALFVVVALLPRRWFAR